MNPQLIYWLIFVLFTAAIVFMQIKYGLIADAGTATSRPYSFSRVQLIWWTLLLLTAMVSIIIVSGNIPSLTQSSLVLLGIGSLSTVSARLIDISDRQNFEAATAASAADPQPINQQICTGNFFTDILSDRSGISVHRLQAFIFNLVFGLWFIYRSVTAIVSISAASTQDAINKVIPDFSEGNLVLLGLSAGVYVTIKSTENK